MRILLSYDIEGHSPDETAQRTIMAVRNAVPHIGGGALLPNFVAHIGSAERAVAEVDRHFSFVVFEASGKMPTTPENEMSAVYGRTGNALRGIICQLPVSFGRPLLSQLREFLRSELPSFSADRRAQFVMF